VEPDVPAGEVPAPPSAEVVAPSISPPAGLPPLAIIGIVAGVGIALGIVAGLRMGRAIGAASLAPPPKVEPIFVERCAECEEKARTNGHVPSVTAEQVAAKVAAQEGVEGAE
jgi:hypothetical protein